MNMEHLLAATNKVVELHNENVQLHTELADAKCKLAKYQNDSGDDSLYNVRRLRSELTEAIKQRDALAEALSYLASCGYDGPLPQYARDKAFLALANYKSTNETKRP
jgi:hypothetical protein